MKDIAENFIKQYKHLAWQKLELTHKLSDRDKVIFEYAFASGLKAAIDYKDIVDKVLFKQGGSDVKS